ncbi:hypothetical protein [Aquamicrobium terrae]
MQVMDDAAIASLGVEAADLAASVSLALAAHSRGEMLVEPKRMQLAASGAYAIGTHGIWARRELAFFHNLVGLDREPVKGGRSTYRSAQVLFRSSDAVPLLTIHGNTMSSVLPVVMTVVAAQRFAPDGVESVSFIGAGLQARLHLDALAGMFPVKRVFSHSRSRDSSLALSEYAGKRGIETVICTNPQDAVRGGDIVVSSISESFGVEPFLDIDWLKPTALLSSVDMLRPWSRGSGREALVIADDVLQARQMIESGRVPGIFPIDHELGGLLAGEQPEPGKASGPVILFHPGCCAGLFGMAMALHERAQLSTNR